MAVGNRKYKRGFWDDEGQKTRAKVCHGTAASVVHGKAIKGARNGKVPKNGDMADRSGPRRWIGGRGLQPMRDKEEA